MSAQGSLGGSQASCTTAQAWKYYACYTGMLYHRNSCYRCTCALTLTTDVQNGAHASFTWLLSSSATSPNYYPGYTGSLTPAVCTTGCRGHGFPYAALYNGTQCYCGTRIPSRQPGTSAQSGYGSTSGTRPGGVATLSNCQVENVTCSGDSTQYCGGNAAAAVYLDPSFTTGTTATGSSNYAYVGCFTDTSPGALYATISTDNTTSCENYCGSLGYPLAGRSGFDSDSGLATCGCGTELQTGNQAAESQCNYRCSGGTGAS